MLRISAGLGLGCLLCAVGLGCSEASDKDPSTPTAGTMSQPAPVGQGGASGAAGSSLPNPIAGSGSRAGSGGSTVPPVAGGGAGGSTAPISGAGGGGNGGGGVGGAAGTQGDAGAPMDDHVPPCVSDAKDVVMIGDSYIDWITHTFVADMRAEAGQQWPSYAIGGTSMATGGIGHIPDQLDTALAENAKIKAVVMTGGGNDILVYDGLMFPDGGMCTSVPNAPMIEDCQKIVQAALDEASALMDETADAGVRDIVYFFYPHIPGGGLISGPTPNPILDYALPRARKVCESSLERTAGRMKCTFIDMVPVFEGKAGLFADEVSEMGDGVHPNSMGSKVMAKEVWRVMKQECIGQPASSGCCATAP
jgi:hypothetical protein